MRLVVLVFVTAFMGSARAGEVVHETTSSAVARTCNEAVASVDMPREHAKALAKGAPGLSVESICKCVDDGAGNCTKDTSGNESWSVAMRWVR